MKRIILAAAAVAAPLLAALALVISVPSAYAATAQGSVVRSCSGNYPLGSTGAWYGDLSVRNMRCRRAHRILSGHRIGTTRHSLLIPGWRCPVIGYYGDGGIFRCTRPGRAMRFSAGG